MRLLARPRKSGYGVAVDIPAEPSAVLTLVGSLLGSPDRELIQRPGDEIKAIMAEITNQLQNKVERASSLKVPG